MEAPIRPVEPGKRPADEDLINYAMAIAIVEIKKALKDKICVKTSVSTWSDPSGSIEIRVPGTQEEWTVYRAAMSQYYDDCNQYEAHKRGVSVQTYLEAKKKAEEYARKKCDKMADRDIDDFLQDMIELPDEDEIIIAS